jgi:hypothetical protein
MTDTPKITLDDLGLAEALVGKTLVLESTTLYPCGVGAGNHPEAVYHPQGHKVTETVEYKIVEVKA